MRGLEEGSFALQPEEDEVVVAGMATITKRARARGGPEYRSRALHTYDLEHGTVKAKCKTLTFDCHFELLEEMEDWCIRRGITRRQFMEEAVQRHILYCKLQRERKIKHNRLLQDAIELGVIDLD